MWSYVYPSHELYHHGILGQRWGKKNGPPYPIAASAHSASEKKAGWKKSLDGGVSKKGARAYTKELNRTDKKIAREQFDRTESVMKAYKYAIKADKAMAKGKSPEKVINLRESSKYYVDKYKTHTKNLEKYKEKTASVIKKLKNEGYNVHSKRTDRLVHQGRSIAKSALLTAGVSLISVFAGTPVMAGVMSRYTVEGRRYKVKPGTSRRGKEYHSNKLTAGSALRRATSYRRSLI